MRVHGGIWILRRRERYRLRAERASRDPILREDVSGAPRQLCMCGQTGRTPFASKLTSAFASSYSLQLCPLGGRQCSEQKSRWHDGHLNGRTGVGVCQWRGSLCIKLVKAGRLTIELLYMTRVVLPYQRQREEIRHGRHGEERPTLQDGSLQCLPISRNSCDCMSCRLCPT